MLNYFNSSRFILLQTWLSFPIVPSNSIFRLFPFHWQMFFFYGQWKQKQESSKRASTGLNMLNHLEYINATINAAFYCEQRPRTYVWSGYPQGGRVWVELKWGGRLQHFQLFSPSLIQAFWYIHLPWVPSSPNLKTWSLANFCLYPCLKVV